ncbi:MAG: hypothetical protein MK110_13820 [Fuerstiella sp.]|nr:hypothetical protein [Fuerstiella sp.]
MTIRYECPECSSVMKIKVEKAGRPGKCPKCRFEFTIPDVSQHAKPLLTEDDLVDMPLEITRIATTEDTSTGSTGEFNPMSTLNSNSASDRTESVQADSKIKPSVAELMKEHHKKLAKKELRRSSQTVKRVNPLLDGVETAGTAAEAITRSYEKKRTDTDVPILSREERRAAEMQASLIRYILKNGTILVAAVMFAFLLLDYVLSRPQASVVEVTGKVTIKGKPLDGCRIRFIPIQQRDGPALDGGASSAVVGNDGEFRLLYNPTLAGAIVAEHQITIENEFGLPLSIPEEFTRREVRKDAENYFEFDL